MVNRKSFHMEEEYSDDIISIQKVYIVIMGTMSEQRYAAGGYAPPGKRFQPKNWISW